MQRNQEVTLEDLAQAIGNIDKRFDKVDERLDKLESCIHQVEEKVTDTIQAFAKDFSNQLRQVKSDVRVIADVLEIERDERTGRLQKTA